MVSIMYIRNSWFIGCGWEEVGLVDWVGVVMVVDIRGFRGEMVCCNRYVVMYLNGFYGREEVVNSVVVFDGRKCFW